MMRATQPAPASYDASGLVTGGVRLSNRRARSSAFGTHGRSAIRVGILVVGFGLAVGAATWLARSGHATRPNGAPRIIGLVMAAIIAATGAALAGHGVRDTRRVARVRRLREAHPGEPWRWDYLWNERGTFDDTTARARYFITLGVVLLVFLIPFHWIGFFAFRGSAFGLAVVPFGLVALLFDAFALGLVAAGGYLIARRLKYGRGLALFSRFPYRRGERLELHVQAPPALPQHALVTATLRCVQERYVTTGTGEDRSTNVQCFEVYRDTSPAELIDAGSGIRALRIAFDVPRDVPTTDLASRPCRYWEVDVEAATDGVDYAARFLVPVY
jgi:hypothetical protein